MTPAERARERLAADEYLDHQMREFIRTAKEPFGSVSIPCALRALTAAEEEIEALRSTPIAEGNYIHDSRPL